MKQQQQDLQTTMDWMMELLRKHENSGKLYSVAKKKSKIYDRFKHKRRKPQTSPAKAAKETKQQARSESLKNLKST